MNLRSCKVSWRSRADKSFPAAFPGSAMTYLLLASRRCDASFVPSHVQPKTMPEVDHLRSAKDSAIISLYAVGVVHSPPLEPTAK
jgi:hypothetical protein